MIADSEDDDDEDEEEDEELDLSSMMKKNVEAKPHRDQVQALQPPTKKPNLGQPAQQQKPGQ